MKAAGFQVRVQDMDDLTEIKQASGVPMRLRTCHTAIVDGYVVEGHVPADLVKKMLAEKPKVTGIAVPGCRGSPRMRQGDQKAYDVLLFDKAGRPRCSVEQGKRGRKRRGAGKCRKSAKFGRPLSLRTMTLQNRSVARFSRWKDMVAQYEPVGFEERLAALGDAGATGGDL
jgi:hypothetical protein